MTEERKLHPMEVVVTTSDGQVMLTGLLATQVKALIAEVKRKEVVWPDRLTLRDSGVVADEGQRIFTTATGHGYAEQSYIRADCVSEEDTKRLNKLRQACGGRNGLLIIDQDSDGTWYILHGSDQSHGPTFISAIDAMVIKNDD